MAENINVLDLVRKRAVETNEQSKEIPLSVPNVVSGNQSSGIWIPVPHDELPSCGEYYQEQIFGRPLGAMEVKQLSSMNQKNATAIVDTVLKACIKGVPFEEVLLADKMYLLFWLRQNTYKRSNYVLTFDCTECGKKSTSSFSLSDLVIKSKADDVSFDIKVGEKIFVVKYRTIQDEDEVSKFLKKNNRDGIFDEEWLELASSIVSINGKEMSLLHKYQYLVDPVRFTADDYAELTYGINQVGIGVEPLVKVKCSMCGGYSDTLIPFRADYFLPSSKSSRNM